MSDLELLFLILAVLYAWECACWLPVGSIGFVTWLGRQWRITQPGSLLGNQRGGFILAPPLPPLGGVLVGQPLPLGLSEEGVLADPGGRLAAGIPIPGDASVIRWSDIKNVSAAGKKVKINGATFLRASSAPTAFRLARQLKELSKLPSPKRAGTIEALVNGSLDVKAAEKRWQQFDRLAAPLRLLTNAVFIFLFVFAPLVIWRVGFLRMWPGLLFGLLALTASAAVSFWRIHKTFYPDAGDDRFMHFLITLLSPATTPRARDTLSRPLLEPFHPLAVAKVFCAETRFRSLARRAMLDLRYPARNVETPGEGTRPATEALVVEIERAARAGWSTALEWFLRQQKLEERELIAPPAPNDESCATFCPRCESQFTTREGICADCGVALKPLGKSSGQTEGAVPASKR